MFRALASDERIYSISDTEQKPASDLVLRGAGWDILLRFGEAAKVLQKALRALRARLGTVERQTRLALDTDSNTLCIHTGGGSDYEACTVFYSRFIMYLGVGRPMYITFGVSASRALRGP
jgi:hypothetical protein